MSAPTSADGLAQNAEAVKGSLDRFDPDRWAGEPKLDGWRLLVHRDEDGVHIYTRSAKCHDGSLPAIEEEMMVLPPGTWLDGEAVALTVREGRLVHEWGTVQSILGSDRRKAAARSDRITFAAFDLISHGGLDARPLPYDERRDLLVRLTERAGFQRTMVVPQVVPTDASLDALMAQGFEGMMLKDRHARYASGQRGGGWLKVKPQETVDVVVTGFKPGEAGFAGLVGAVEFGEFGDDGEIVETGRCSGMTMRVREDMTKNPDRWLGSVIEVKHMGRMPTGGYRHPQFARRREDKSPSECVMGAS